MAQAPNEDLFETTKMTFGEHLEELRVCLVRSLIGLGIGFLLGLLVAGPVVKKIEVPLKAALEKFHFETTLMELQAEYGEDSIPQSIQEFMDAQNMVYEQVYWEVEELNRLLDVVSRAETNDGEPLRGTGDGADGSDEQRFVIGVPGAPSSLLVETRIWRPLDADVTSLSAHEPFMIWLKAALITGAVISSPWVFYHVWAFVAAGLYPHEKSYVYVFLPFSLGLFLAGAALAFFFVFEPVLDFLFGFNRLMNIDPDPRISEWMSFVLFLPLGFGISFQLPLVMLLLERIGVMSIQAYLQKWRIAVLVIFVVAMLLTPADPISMLLMAMPLTILYFGGIGLCRWMPKRRNPFGEGYDPQ